MSLKKLGVALLAVIVLSAIAANSAFAANEFSETGGTWFVGGSKLGEGEANQKAITTEAVGTQKLETTVAGTKLDITALGLTCLSCHIDNTANTVAQTRLRLSLTTVTVTEPAGCSVAGGKIETKALTAILGMNTAGTKATLKITPESGTTFATVEVTGTSCPLAGLYKVTGTIFAQEANATGVFATSQELTTSKAIQESAGTSTSAKFGENSAILTGASKGTLEGSPSWGGEK